MLLEAGKIKSVYGWPNEITSADLVIEVLSKGTARRERGVKFTDYAANGIGEYWIVNPGKQTVEQYELDLDMEEYAHIGTFINSQEIESRQVTGFRIPVLALFDEQTNMEAHDKLFLPG